MGEWDGLPWHERQLLLEGLVDEFSDGDDAEMSTDSAPAGLVIEQAN